MLRAIATLLILLILCHEAADARTRRKRIRRRPRPVPQYTVTPAPEIDDRVAAEIRRVHDFIESPDDRNLLDLPYLVSALYYRSGFLSAFAQDKPDASPPRRILASILRDLTPEIRARLYDQLQSRYAADVNRFPNELVRPVAGIYSKRRRRSTHQRALDVFLDEGSPVHTLSRGVVILTDRGWRSDEPFSSTSPQGGNCVIVFEPDSQNMYRYCHLEEVLVVPGSILAAGQQIGTVGHTGFNAARPGHGRHLHLEITSFAPDKAQREFLTRLQLTRILDKASDAPKPIEEPPQSLARNL